MSAGRPSLAAQTLQCVLNVSEGRDQRLIEAWAHTAGASLLDVHCDRDHNRSVLTLAGADVETAAQRVATRVVAELDIGNHQGAHPRLGALDVVPWVHLVVGSDGRLHDGSIEVATAARDRFARWAAAQLRLPCFLYGPAAGGDAGGERTLPYLRREAWQGLVPDVGPSLPHPTAGAACVGSRRALVAYNLWLARPDLARAKRLASEVRTPQIRTLGLQVGEEVQVSCNLIDPWTIGPGAAFDAVASRAEVSRAELVGLLPLGVLDAVPSSRWSLLDVGPSRTIEARLERAGLDGGRFRYHQPPHLR